MTRFNAASITIILLLVSALHHSGSFGQTKRSSKEAVAENQGTFRVPVGVVVVHALVTDKHGKAVTDLEDKDFRIYEDNKQQHIQTIALESYKSSQPAEQRIGDTTIIAPKAPVSRAPRPRLISFIIDDITSVPDDHFIRVTEAMRKFVEQDMGPSDQVEIISGSGIVQYAFSNNKELLLEKIAGLPKKLNWSKIGKSNCPELTDLQAQRIYHSRGSLSISAGEAQQGGLSPDAARMFEQKFLTSQGDGAFELAVLEAMSCLNLNWGNPRDRATAMRHVRNMAAMQYEEQNSRNLVMLRTLTGHFRLLRHIDAVKSAIIFSNGFQVDDIAFELQDAVEQALRSGVVINTLNLQGLRADSHVERRFISADAMPTYARLYQEGMTSQENPLYQMTNETGGILFHDNNDFYRGIREISERKDYYYVLTYSIPPHKPDGRYYSIKLEVTRPDLRVSYRKGYYAPKEEISFERRKKEDIVEALQSPGNFNEIPIDLSYNYYQYDDTTYAVSLLIKADIHKLRFLEEDSRHKNLISTIVAAFDENDRYLDGLDKSVEFRLTDENYASLKDRGMMARIEFKLPLGRYKLKAIVREALEGKMSSLTKAIEIP